MMTVGLHARWSGQAARAAPVRDFIEYTLEKPGACFMRRLDIAQYWIDNHATFTPAQPRRPGRA
jgi:hypothetical protein